MEVKRLTDPQVAPSGQGPGFQQAAVPNVPQGAFGEGLARGMGQLSNSLERIQDEDDKAVVKERVEQYRQFSRGRLYRDDDAFFQRQGRSAYDSLGAMNKELDDHLKGLSEGLSPNQSRLFKRVSNEYFQRDVDGMTSHAQKGRMTWLNDQDSAIVTSAQEDAALYWNDNDGYVTQIRKTVGNLATRNGWAPEKRDLETDKAVTVAHVGAINNILRDNPAGARAYFDKHRDEISPSVHDDIETRIDQQDNLWKAQDLGDTIRSEGGSRSERLAKVNEIEDPNVRKLVRSQVEHDFAQEEANEKEVQADIISEVMKQVIAGTPASSWATANPRQWERLTGTQQAKLLRGFDYTQSVPEVYYTMRGMVNTDPDQAKKYLLNNLGNLSWADARGFMDELFKKQPEVNPNVLTNKVAFDKMVGELMGKRPNKGEARKIYARRENILLGIYQERIDQWREANGDPKYIPHEARQKLLDDMTIEFVDIRERWGFDFLALDKSYTIEEIPDNDREDIIDALKAQNIPVTTENILKIWASQQ